MATNVNEVRDLILEKTDVGPIEVMKVLGALRKIAQAADSPADVFRIVAHVMDIED